MNLTRCIAGAAAGLLAIAASQPLAARTLPQGAAAFPVQHDAPITLVTIQHATWSRVSFVLHGAAEPEIEPVQGGVDLHFAPAATVQAAGVANLREISGFAADQGADGTTAHIRFACDCEAEIGHAPGLLRLDIHERSNAIAAAKPAKTQKAPAGGKQATELDALRRTLSDKITQLNAVAPPTASGGLSQPAVSLPPCAPLLDMTGWKGTGSFIDRLVALRTRVAISPDRHQEMAALAEFYLANGLPGEALAAATEALGDDPPPAAAKRLSVVADIARLLKREALDPGSVLLASPSACQRTDAALWRALSAAVAGDAEGAARDANAAAATLRHFPEPVLSMIAYRIADAAGEKAGALRAMAGIVRNSPSGLPEEESARFLLQAHIARLDGATAEERVYLERAARFSRTPPGLIAEARLAALRAGEAGEAGAHNEEVLADIARTYRYDTVGQDAADQYAERQLQRANYAGALELADENAGAPGAHVRESRGASLAARILRILLVDPAGAAALPDSLQRLALYWRYEGYATPGGPGDDIRLGAAATMLAQQLPDAALDVLTQLSDAVAATAPAQMLRAQAEARAGDPALAMQMLGKLPDSDAVRRTAADALARMDRPAEAAHRLDAVANVAARSRRADLLFAAKAWGDAAAAYAALMRDAAVSDPVAGEAAERYAAAIALAGQPPSPDDLTASKLPAPWLALLRLPAAAPEGTAPVPAVQAALERARRIEALLPPPAAAAGQTAEPQGS